MLLMKKKIKIFSILLILLIINKLMVVYGLTLLDLSILKKELELNLKFILII